MRHFNTPWVGSTRNLQLLVIPGQKHLASWDSSAVAGDLEEGRLMVHGNSDHFCTGPRRVAPKPQWRLLSHEQSCSFWMKLPYQDMDTLRNRTEDRQDEFSQA